MLTSATRKDFRTLLDAITLSAPDDDRLAVAFLETGAETLEFSRAQFREQISRAAGAWQSLGVQARDTVVIAPQSMLQSLWAFWGAIGMGAIPNMFAPLADRASLDYYAGNIKLQIKGTGAKAMLTLDDLAATLGNQVDCEMVGSSQFSELMRSVPPFAIGDYQASPDDIAYLQSSSGTTGPRKIMAISHEQILGNVASFSESLEISTQDVVVNWMPLYHDGGLVVGCTMPLVQGLPNILMDATDWARHPALLMHAIDTYKGSVCMMPNFAFMHCARRIRQKEIEGLSLASMRAFINGSERVYQSSFEAFVDAFASYGIEPHQLTAAYGMAENTAYITQTPIDQPPLVDYVRRDVFEAKLIAEPVEPDASDVMVMVSVGPAVPGVRLKVVDEDGNQLPDRHVGEIALSGEFFVSNFYKRPDLGTTPFLPDGWLLTGDMGYLSDGELFITGRKKDLIITAGKNIYPADLEEIVNTVPGVRPGRTVVLGIPDEQEGTELIAVVAEATTNDPDERSEIVRAIRRTVAKQTSITANYVNVVDKGWIIKTTSGKVARFANREKWLKERSQPPTQ